MVEKNAQEAPWYHKMNSACARHGDPDSMAIGVLTSMMCEALLKYRVIGLESRQCSPHSGGPGKVLLST
jgi:hypothetical protein